jgi:predicted ATPase
MLASKLVAPELANRPVTPELMERVIEKAPDSASLYVCETCQDYRFIFPPGQPTRPCEECIKREADKEWQKYVEEKIEKAVPTKHLHIFRGKFDVLPERFKGQKDAPALVKMQSDHIRKVRAHMDDNFFMHGETGVGKSAIGFFLLRVALETKRRPAYAFSIADYLRSLRPVDNNGLQRFESDIIDIGTLRQKHTRYFVLIDEIHALGQSPTSTAADRLLELAEAITYWGPPGGHQYVVTSNYNPDDLSAFWSAQNSGAAGPAIRRLLEGGTPGRTHELKFRV